MSEDTSTATTGTAATSGRSLAVDMVTFDCADPQALSRFWAAALQAEVGMDVGDFVILRGRPAVAFQQVEDPSPGKNRIHLDLSGADRAEEVARLLELGATVVQDHDHDGFAWTILSDPAGNQFCVSDPHQA